VLRVPPRSGRTFREGRQFAEAHLIVLSRSPVGVWKFASDREAIGPQGYVNEERTTVSA